MTPFSPSATPAAVPLPPAFPDPGAADAARLRAWLESVEQLAAAEGLPPEGAA